MHSTRRFCVALIVKHLLWWNIFNWSPEDWVYRVLIKLIEQSEKNPREGKTFPSGKYRYFASGCAVLTEEQKQWSKKPARFQTKKSLILSLHSLFYVCSRQKCLEPLQFCLLSILPPCRTWNWAMWNRKLAPALLRLVFSSTGQVT